MPALPGAHRGLPDRQVPDVTNGEYRRFLAEGGHGDMPSAWPFGRVPYRRRQPAGLQRSRPNRAGGLCRVVVRPGSGPPVPAPARRIRMGNTRRPVRRAGPTPGATTGARACRTRWRPACSRDARRVGIYPEGRLCPVRRPRHGRQRRGIRRRLPTGRLSGVERSSRTTSSRCSASTASPAAARSITGFRDLARCQRRHGPYHQLPLRHGIPSCGGCPMSPKDSPETRAFGAHCRPRARYRRDGRGTAEPWPTLVEINDSAFTTVPCSTFGQPLAACSKQLRTPQGRGQPRRRQRMVCLRQGAGDAGRDGRARPAGDRGTAGTATHRRSPARCCATPTCRWRQWSSTSIGSGISGTASARSCRAKTRSRRSRRSACATTRARTGNTTPPCGTSRSATSPGSWIWAWYARATGCSISAGGHGAYATELARTLPGVSGEIWDLETVAEIAREDDRRARRRGPGDLPHAGHRRPLGLSGPQGRRGAAPNKRAPLFRPGQPPCVSIVRTACRLPCGRAGGWRSRFAVRLEEATAARLRPRSNDFPSTLVLNAAGGQLMRP